MKATGRSIHMLRGFNFEGLPIVMILAGSFGVIIALITGRRSSSTFVIVRVLTIVSFAGFGLAHQGGNHNSLQASTDQVAKDAGSDGWVVENVIWARHKVQVSFGVCDPWMDFGRVQSTGRYKVGLAFVGQRIVPMKPRDMPSRVKKLCL